MPIYTISELIDALTTNPDITGLECVYVDNLQSLRPGGFSQHGFPNPQMMIHSHQSYDADPVLVCSFVKTLRLISKPSSQFSFDPNDQVWLHDKNTGNQVRAFPRLVDGAVYLRYVES